MASCGLQNIAIIGMVTLGYCPSNYPISTVKEIFVSHYGVGAMVCFEIWYKLIQSGKLLLCQTTKHLFWTLLNLKVYCRQRVIRTMLRTTRTTFNKHGRHITKLIADLKMAYTYSWKQQQNIFSVIFNSVKLNFNLIKLRNRYMKSKGCTCCMTVDGTDFFIQETKRFWSGWYSHKFKFLGLRYEIGVCLETGWIVRVNGPYTCGKFNNIIIFRLHLQGQLDENKRVVADGGWWLQG